MHFIHLNVSSLQFKIDAIRSIAELKNATVIGLRETKHYNIVLNSEMETEEYELARSDRSRKEGDVTCFVKSSISYNRKYNFYINVNSIFIEIFLNPNQF